MTPESLLALLDRGAVREAVAAAGVTEPPSEQADPVFHLLRGWYLMSLGRNDEAIQGLRRLVESEDQGENPDRFLLSHVLLALGTATVLSGDAVPGSIQLERALSLADPERVWLRAQALRFLAAALESRCAWEGAAARYDAATALYRRISHDFGIASSEYGAAAALIQMGYPAEERLRAAVDRFRAIGGPSLAAALAMLATEVTEADPAEAARLFEEASRVEANSPLMDADLQGRRALFDLQQGQAAAGLARIEELVDQLPPKTNVSYEVRRARAELYLALGQDQKALVDAQKIIVSNPLRPHGWAIQLLVAARREDFSGVDVAISELERSLIRHPSLATHLQEAARLLETDEPERALCCLKLCMRAGGQVPVERLCELVERGARIPLGPLFLEDRIGAGGMGTVWRARHRDTAAWVAVKVLKNPSRSPRIQQLFDAELRALARLDHPGIVRILAAHPLDRCAALLTSQPEGSPALVMELVDGQSLEHRSFGWSWRSARLLLLGILDALAHAHSRGVLHLDIHPGNVLVTGLHSPSPRIVDFGLAGLVDDGRVAGTPAYMAPEQTRARDLGPWTDLYALGCTAWWLLTGAAPFDAADPRQIFELHRTAPLPTFLPRFPVPEGVESWLRQLLAKNPEHRYRRCADAAWTLVGLESGILVDLASSAETASPYADLLTFVPDRSTEHDILLSGALAASDGGPAPITPFPERGWLPDKRPAPRFLPGAGEGLLPHRLPRLVGREAEQDRLWRALQTVARSGRGQILSLVGRKGSGKSRLGRWLCEVAHASGAAEVCDWDQLQPTGDRGNALQELLGTVRQSARPWVILLDESDHSLSQFLELPCLILLLAERARSDRESVELGPLPEADLRNLLDQLLPLERSLAARIAARSGGSPGFAVAILRDLVAQGALIAGTEGQELASDRSISLPADDLELWRSRLDSVAPEGSPRRTAWEIAAILGKTVDLQMWQTLCLQMGLLEPASLLESREGWWKIDGDSLQFLDTGVWEALKQQPEASGRARPWHAAVAARLPADSPLLGRHLFGAGRFRAALAPLRSAAADAVNSTRILECTELLELWDRAAESIGMAPDDPKRASPLIVRSYRAFHTGEDQLAPLDRALELVRGKDKDLEAKAWYARAGVLKNDRRWAEAREAYETAIQLEGGEQTQVVGLCWLGLATCSFGEGLDGSADADRARVLFEARWPFLASRCDAVSGRGLRELGRLDEAAPLLERVVVEAIRWPMLLAEAEYDLAQIDLARSQPERAILRLEHGRSVLGEVGSDHALGFEIDLAELYQKVGRTEDARGLVASLLSRYRSRLSDENRQRAERLSREL